MEAWDFNGNESGDKIIESDEKEKPLIKWKNLSVLLRVFYYINN